MRGCNCSFIIEKGSFIEWEAETGIVSQLNTFQTSVKYIVYTQFMAASALLKNTVSIEEWMAAATFMTKKHFTLKKLFPATKRSNLRGKSYFLEQLLWLTVLFYKLLFH